MGHGNFAFFFLNKKFFIFNFCNIFLILFLRIFLISSDGSPQLYSMSKLEMFSLDRDNSKHSNGYKSE